MSNTTTSADASDPGQIAFYQSFRPPLQAGDYILDATQSVTDLPNGNGTPQYGTKQSFSIAAPQFTLPADAIRSVYPPAHSNGNFNQSLPHIVLNNRTLPWLRPIDPDIADPRKSAPWLALLTFQPDELGEKEGPVNGTVADLKKPPAGVLGPKINFDGIPTDQQLLIFDIPGGLFSKIAPTYEDQFYLAHVRQVNTDGKEILGIDADGWFSLVVGNRLVGAGGVNTVCLISLEGMKDYLPGGSSPPSASEKLRVAVLANWTFEAADARGNFLEILEALGTRHVKSEPDKLNGIGLMQMPFSLPDPQTKEEKIAADTIAIGFAPVSTELRAGETTTSWYRGPLSAVPTKRVSHGSYVFGDHAVRYDPDTGIFDMSYAAAWQIGRLLALSDATFAQLLLKNLTADAMAAEKAIALNDFVETVDKALAPTDGQPLLATIAAAAGHNASLTAAHHVLSRTVAERAGRTPGDFPKLPDPRDRLTPDRYPGVVTKADHVMMRADTGDILATIKRRVFGND